MLTEQCGVQCEHSIGDRWTDRREPGRPQGYIGHTWPFSSLLGELSASFHAGTLTVDEAYPGLFVSTSFMLGSQQAQVESSIQCSGKKRGVTDPKEDSQGVWLWYPKCWGLQWSWSCWRGKGTIPWSYVSHCVAGDHMLPVLGLWETRLEGTVFTAPRKKQSLEPRV